eukprot:m.358730 g.358730  ORF g.358730 m.358730 type:complete len:90 (+) comp107443_c0_seq1:80-349(+)
MVSNAGNVDVDQQVPHVAAVRVTNAVEEKSKYTLAQMVMHKKDAGFINAGHLDKSPVVHSKKKPSILRHFGVFWFATRTHLHSTSTCRC